MDVDFGLVPKYVSDVVLGSLFGVFWGFGFSLDFAFCFIWFCILFGILLGTWTLMFAVGLV